MSAIERGVRTEARLQRLYDEPYVLRIFPDIASEPNRYTGSAAVTVNRLTRVALIQGLVIPKFDRAVYDAVVAELIRYGVEAMQYERRNTADSRFRFERIAP